MNNSNNKTDQIQLAKKVHKTIQTVLPDEIITNILSRHPARSVARFQSVCKQWRSWINDPYFLNERRRNRSSKKICIVSKRICNEQITFYHFDIESSKLHVRFFKINLEMSPFYYLSNVVNGLACAFVLTNRSDIHLLNFYELEAPESELPRSCHCDSWAMFDFNWVGLGFDTSKGAYKVVRIFTQDVINYICEILTVGSLNDGQWRRVGEAPAPNCNYEPIFLHRALHWKPRYETGIDPLALIKFDVEAEKFEMMDPMPHSCPPSRFMGISELENCICSLFCTAVFEIDIWILKNYKKCEWSKIHSVRVNNIMPSYHPPCFVGVADGVIILEVQEVNTEGWMIHCFDIRDEVYHKLMYSN